MVTSLRVQLSAALLICASLSAAADAASRSPTGRWIVNFDDSQCFAIRGYGTKEAPLDLVLKVPPLGNVMQISVIRPGKGGRYAEQREATITFDGAQSVATTLLAFTPPKSGQRLFRVNLPLEHFAAARKAKALSIRASGDLDETFALTQMEPLLKVLDECVVGLRKFWNVTEEEVGISNLKEGPRSLSGLFRAEDYPGVAMEELRQGTVTFVLLIDESGRVADCTVSETSGVAVLDAQSCAVVKERARFKPAVGLDGKPAKAGFTQRVSWRIR